MTNFFYDFYKTKGQCITIPKTKIERAKKCFLENTHVNINILEGLINNNGSCLVLDCDRCVIRTVSVQVLCTSKTAHKLAVFLLENKVFENLDFDGSIDKGVSVCTSIWEE